MAKAEAIDAHPPLGGSLCRGTHARARGKDHAASR